MEKYIRNNETISGRLHDETVMMDIEQGKYFSLNPVATRIWDLLEKESSLEELVEELLSEFEVDEAQCRKDVSDYLQEMEKLRLIKKSA
ncbi:PqqD family protein [Cyclobacteriaceae bacterium YHN15]|nr:PqqD family protein [Cyclobacteriaceae bacterium YHN15]